jgi:hypothetical protein
MDRDERKTDDDAAHIKRLMVQMRRQLDDLEADILSTLRPHPPELDDYYVAIATITSATKARDWLYERIKKLEQDNSAWAARTIILTRTREALKAFTLEENDRWIEAMDEWEREG